MSVDTLDLPIIDMSLWLTRSTSESTSKACDAECRAVADSLHRYGLAILKDPRTTEADNDAFIDMMERYFEQSDELKSGDVRKELHYQVGVTPSFVELPRNHCDRMKAFKATDAPVSLCPPEKDAKARFFWRLGERPEETEFKELNAPPVLPAGFPEWEEVCAS